MYSCDGLLWRLHVHVGQGISGLLQLYPLLTAPFSAQGTNTYTSCCICQCNFPLWDYLKDCFVMFCFATNSVQSPTIGGEVSDHRGGGPVTGTLRSAWASWPVRPALVSSQTSFCCPITTPSGFKPWFLVHSTVCWGFFWGGIVCLAQESIGTIHDKTYHPVPPDNERGILRTWSNLQCTWKSQLPKNCRRVTNPNPMSVVSLVTPKWVVLKND